ncbi:hypothetical protein [Rhodococcus jostii]|uniref:hypothetical protein n=1 Tax=Rhodococcus jostii TaxID=132919 RepID=UPI00363F881E
MPDLDVTTMTDEQIEQYAHQQITVCGVPGEDPAGLILALRNMPARVRALRDPYWHDLVSQEATAFREREERTARALHDAWAGHPDHRTEETP